MVVKISTHDKSKLLTFKFLGMALLGYESSGESLPDRVSLHQMCISIMKDHYEYTANETFDLDDLLIEIGDDLDECTDEYCLYIDFNEKAPEKYVYILGAGNEVIWEHSFRTLRNNKLKV